MKILVIGTIDNKGGPGGEFRVGAPEEIEERGTHRQHFRTI